MYIDILRVHNNWREERGSSDTLRGVVKIRENNAWKIKLVLVMLTIAAYTRD